VEKIMKMYLDLEENNYLVTKQKDGKQWKNGKPDKTMNH